MTFSMMTMTVMVAGGLLITAVMMTILLKQRDDGKTGKARQSQKGQRFRKQFMDFSFRIYSEHDCIVEQSGWTKAEQCCLLTGSLPPCTLLTLAMKQNSNHPDHTAQGRSPWIARGAANRSPAVAEPRHAYG